MHLFFCCCCPIHSSGRTKPNGDFLLIVTVRPQSDTGVAGRSVMLPESSRKSPFKPSVTIETAIMFNLFVPGLFFIPQRRWGLDKTVNGNNNLDDGTFRICEFLSSLVLESPAMFYLCDNTVGVPTAPDVFSDNYTVTALFMVKVRFL